MIAQFGSHAELMAGERMDAALLANDRDGYEEWRLVAKAIALMTRQNQDADATKPKHDTEKAAEPAPPNRMRG